MLYSNKIAQFSFKWFNRS